MAKTTTGHIVNLSATDPLKLDYVWTRFACLTVLRHLVSHVILLIGNLKVIFIFVDFFASD